MRIKFAKNYQNVTPGTTLVSHLLLIYTSWADFEWAARRHAAVTVL